MKEFTHRLDPEVSVRAAIRMLQFSSDPRRAVELLRSKLDGLAQGLHEVAVDRAADCITDCKLPIAEFGCEPNETDCGSPGDIGGGPIRGIMVS